MDIFKFTNPTHPTKMEQGEILNDFESKMWVERYRDAGEFALRARVSSGMRTKLPIGSFISHTDTHEIMIVENHEITEDRGTNPEIIITGRGFETFLENRVVGSNQVFPTAGPIPDYNLAADYTWNQVVVLVSDHIIAASLANDDNELPWTMVYADVAGTNLAVARVIKRGNVYSRMLELMEINSLGVKILRPGPWGDSVNTSIVFHHGIDRTAEIIFSYETGEIESADYLWSNKKFKNAALITGRWIETILLPDAVDYDRRMMFVEASDIDNGFSAPPTGTDLDNVIYAMQQRGIEALAAQSQVALTKAEASKNNIRSKYRTDFRVGDLITVSGDYNETATRRINEYVEIEDETGKSEYPTLTVI